MEIFIIILVLIFLASPVLAIVFFALYMGSKSEVKRLQKIINDMSSVVPPQTSQAPRTSEEAIPAPVNSVTVTPTPVEPQKTEVTLTQVNYTKTPKKFSGVGITFAVGVLLLTIVAAVFITSSWSFIGDIGRVVVLLTYVAVIFGLSALSDKVLKLRQTGFAFYTLGSFLLPISITGIGVLELFGNAFSIKGGTGAIVGAVAAVAFGICGFIGTRIYKKKSYYAISYLGFTWCALFIAGQFGGHTAGFATFGILSLAFQLMIHFKKDLEIKYFNIYSEIVTYLAALASFGYVFSNDSILAITGCAASAISLVVLSLNPKRSWVNFVVPVAALTVWGCSISIASEYCPAGMPVIGALIIGLIYLAFYSAKRTNYVTDFGYPVTMLFFAYFAEDTLSWGGLICLVMASAIMMIMVWRKSSAKVLKVIAAVIFSGLILLISSNIMDLATSSEKSHRFEIMLIASVVTVLSYFVRYFVGETRKFESRLVCESLLGTSLLFTFIQFFETTSTQRIITSVVFFLLWIVMLISVAYKRPATDKTSISSTIFASCVMLSSLGVIASVCDTFDSINFDWFYIVSIILMSALAVAFKFLPESLIRSAKKYMKVLGFVAISVALVVLIASTFAIDINWLMILLCAVVLGLTYLYGFNYIGFYPVSVVLCKLYEIFEENVTSDIVRDLLVLAVFVVFGILGRLIHKKLFTKKYADWFSLLPVFLVFMYVNEEFASITLALFVLNFIGRVKLKTRTIIGIASTFLFTLIFALIKNNTGFDNWALVRISVVLSLVCVIINRYLVKPFKDSSMRVIWFIAVTLAILTDDVVSVFNSSIPDLLIVGGASLLIFIISFIIKRKLWFVQSIVSIMLIGLYFSAVFGSSIVWLIYLLFAGVVLITIAAINESRKRKNEKLNITSEWKW